VSDSTPSAALIDRLRRVAAGSAVPQAAPAAAAADAWLRHGLARGQLHEIYAGDADDGPAAIGFAVALALAAGALPALWVRLEQDEALTGRLHATGLVQLGLPPDALILVVVADAAARLRVAADAARCAGLGSVVIESRGRAPEHDLTATRRLQLAAEASGVTILGVRIGAQVVPSAAATRWGVAATPSALLEADAPGLPAFDVECLRRRGGPAGARCRVEWNRDQRCFDPSFGSSFGQAPLAGAGIPLAVGGAVAIDPAASVRARG
jgi:protein ImuA